MLKKIGYVFILALIFFVTSGAAIGSVNALILQPGYNLAGDNEAVSGESLPAGRLLLDTPAWQQLNTNADPSPIADADGRPNPRFNHAMAYHQASSRLFIFGGQAGSSFFNDVWVLDLNTLTWQELYPNTSGTANSTFPVQRRTAVMTVDEAGQNLYVATGQQQSGANHNDIWRFDLSTNGWQKLSTSTNPEVRYGAAGGVLGGNLVVSHGFDSGRYQNTWLFNVSSGQWQDISPSGTKPVGRCLLDGVAAGNRFVIHGGQSNADTYRADTWILNTATDTWTEVATGGSEGVDKPVGRHFQSLAYAEPENGVLLFGGISQGSTLLNDIWLFNLDTNSWQALSPTGTPPSARRSHAAAWVEATSSVATGMILFGGSIASGDGAGNALSELWLLAYPPAASNPGVLQFDNAAYQVVETDAEATITVARTEGASGTVSVDYRTSDGTATAGADYTATSDTLTFDDGQTEMTFSLPISDDNEIEGDETISLILENPSGASLGNPFTATLTILDSDAVGTLQFSHDNYNAAEMTGSATITVTRTGGVSGTVTVDYQTGGGTATAGADYTAAAGVLTFDDGQAGAQTFNITLIDDAQVEGAETISLSLSNPAGGATLGNPDTAIFTIEDNDTFIYLPAILKNFGLVDEHDADLIEFLLE